MVNSQNNKSDRSPNLSSLIERINAITGINHSINDITDEIRNAFILLARLDSSYKIFSNTNSMKGFILESLLDAIGINLNFLDVEKQVIFSKIEDANGSNDSETEIVSLESAFSVLNQINEMLYLTTPGNDSKPSVGEDKLGLKKKAKKSLGVYYTPPELAKFMTIAVQDLIKENGISDNIELFDFSTGYSIFPSFYIQNIKEDLQKLPQIKAVTCFDILISANIVSHYIIKFVLKYSRDFSVKLSNVLLESFESSSKIEGDFPVIIGNPPYSGHSKWTNKWTDKIIKPFLDERDGLILQKKWLHDDYVKFFGLGIYYIDRKEKGALCFVTNHNYLDGDAFSSFRKTLANTFQKIYILNLGGNKRKMPKSSSDAKDNDKMCLDENIFNINQGTAVIIAIKTEPSGESLAEIYYSEITGVVVQKKEFLTSSTLKTIEWERVDPEQIAYSLIPYEDSHSFEYSSYIPLDQLLKSKTANRITTGMKTLHDDFAIGFTPKDIIEKVEWFQNTHSEEEARERFNLCKQDQWNYQTAKEILSTSDWKKEIIPIVYRPFDIRFTVYNDAVCKFRKPETSDLILKPNSLALIVTRKIKSNSFSHALAVRYPPEVICLSPQTSCNAYVFPVLSGSENQIDLENVNRYFSQRNIMFRDSPDTGETGSKIKYGSKDLLGWVYSILFSESYRKKFARQLSFDFPKIPLPHDEEEFVKLSKLGNRLIEIHTAENLNLWMRKESNCVGIEDNQLDREIPIKKLNYDQNKGELFLNENEDLIKIRNEIWDYKIGDYQPLKSFMQYRKRKLGFISQRDLSIIHNIASIIEKTIEIQGGIDSFLQKTHTNFLNSKSDN